MTLSLQRIEAEVAAQVAARGAGKTICPSEVARALAGDWRGLMPQVRAVAAVMAARGEIVVTQKGVPVDAVAAKGPIRLGLPPVIRG
jgi:stage III sporulation protein SpoIIIAA